MLLKGIYMINRLPQLQETLVPNSVNPAEVADYINSYIRRSVYIEGTNEVKNFLSDILPLLEVGVPIITYNADKTQNRDIFVTESFLKECKQQMLTDFYFKN